MITIFHCGECIGNFTPTQAQDLMLQSENIELVKL